MVWWFGLPHLKKEFMKDLLDLLDREVDKLPKVSKEAHDKEFQRLCEKAKKKSIRDKNVHVSGRPLPKKEFNRRARAWKKSNKCIATACEMLDMPYSSFSSWIRDQRSKGIL